MFCFFFQAEDGIRDVAVTGVQTCALPIFYNGLGGGRRWGFGGFGDATTTVETYTVGTLVVDLFDAKTEKLIWRSSSSDTLSDKADKNKIGRASCRERV